MSQRMVYHVEPAAGNESGWNVKEERGRVVEHHNRKDDAVESATRLARQHPLGQVKIHKSDGSFEEERTYGKDPRRTPG